MPGAKKKKGGKRVRRGKKNTDDNTQKFIATAEKGQEYVRVTHLLGDARLKVVNIEGAERIAIIRGKFRKRVWIKKDDILVIGLRGYQDDRVDVLHKYNASEVKQLVRKGTIPRSLLSDDAGDEGNEEDDGVAWAMPPSEESEEKDENGNPLPKRKPIAPQPIRPNIDDISSDSSEYDLEDI